MKISLIALALSAVLVLIARSTAAQDQPESPETQYLYIERFTVPKGRAIANAVEEGKEWVKIMRDSGEFKSVRLYLHHTGPELAIYIISEPKSWASIENGLDAPIEELDLLNKPLNWGEHSDNLLSEIPVP